MKARFLMVQGTTSDAGKTTLVAALCRALKRRGVLVAPFKPQNMALNSAVSSDGGEIGRAQALQAIAAGVPAHSDMNPVLLKPTSDTEAQVIIQGKACFNMDATTFHAFKPAAREAVRNSWSRLERRFEAIIVEGAGSPAEVNLRDNDIANMGFAVAVNCPVVIVVDIDRGGAFAHLLGTMQCLAPEERELVQGFIINRFRGDRTLLDSGIRWLEDRTGKPVLGVIPHIPGLFLDAEDAITTYQVLPDDEKPPLRILVPVFPRISNHTDFDALRAHSGVNLVFVGPGRPLPPADLIILPGSKNVRDDLAWLRAQGWEAPIRRHLRYGGKILGICGGMQMLGDQIHDPDGVEGTPGSMEGMRLLQFETTLETRKQLRNVCGVLTSTGAEVRGYEIHAGISRGHSMRKPALRLDGHGEGASSEDGQILGTYVHGLFDTPGSCRSLLHWAGYESRAAVDISLLREQSINRLTDIVERHIDLERLFEQTLAISQRGRLSNGSVG